MSECIQMHPRLAAIGPSLVDLNVVVTDVAFFDLCTAYELSPGGWCEIPDLAALGHLLHRLGLMHPGDAVSSDNPKVTQVAGSTTLAMLAVQPPKIRRDATYISTLGRMDGSVTALSQFFHVAVKRLGLTHRFQISNGETSIGLVVSGKTAHDKILFFFPGVSRTSLPDTLLPNECDLLLVDAYELNAGPLARDLDSIIRSGRFPIALSLGNAAIIKGDLRARLMNHLASGHFFAIAGNESEYRALAPEILDAAVPSGIGGRSPLTARTPYVLVTRGAAGMEAWWEGAKLKVDAEPVHSDRIVSTSGAGDAAAGIFFGGVATRAPPLQTLRLAARKASEVLQIQSSMVLG